MDEGLSGLRQLSTRVLDQVERAVVGKRDALELVLLGLLADGHVLLDDYPGLAKTLIARSFARVTSLSTSSLGCSWKVTTASYGFGVKTRRRPLSLSVYE